MKTFALACLVLIVLWCAPTLADEIDLSADSPAQRSLAMEEIWRIGGEDEEEILLGVAANGALDSAGNLYLLDSQLSQVLILDADGELIGTLGREGEGPGEMNRPVGVFLNTENQVGVTQGFPGKIILLNIDGTPGGTIPLGKDPEAGGFAFAGAVAKRGENLVVQHGKGTFNLETGKMTSINLLVRVDEDGAEVARFVEHQQERDLSRQVFDEEANFSELSTWTLGLDQVFTAPERDRYTINVKAMDGTLERTYRRPFTPRKRTAEEKEDVVSGMRMVMNGRRVETENHILDTFPTILGFNVADDGRLFVQHSHQDPKILDEGVARRFDIISPEGKLVEELSLEVPGFNPQQDRLQFLDGTHFLWLRNIESAAATMRSGMMGGDEEEEESEDIEPLEVIFCRFPN